LSVVATPASAYTNVCRDTTGIDCIRSTGYLGASTWGHPVDASGNNCTNYAALRAAENGASNPGNLGNARDWDNKAAGYGIRVDTTPVVGAIAQWEANSGYAGSYGHVAYVESVTSTSIRVSESNWQGGSAIREIPRSDSAFPDHFIHLRDVAPSRCGDFTLGHRR
jgi:surface antigen